MFYIKKKLKSFTLKMTIVFILSFIIFLSIANIFLTIRIYLSQFLNHTELELIFYFSILTVSTLFLYFVVKGTLPGQKNEHIINNAESVINTSLKIKSLPKNFFLGFVSGLNHQKQLRIQQNSNRH